ncbi:MAG: CoA-binding protein [bacterium]
MSKPDPHPQEVMELLKDKSAATRIAVVGASNDPEKYGNIIVQNLKGKGYTVLPINPRAETIAGLAVAPSLDAAEPPVHIVNFVTPPAVTRKVLEKVAELGLPNVWLQDGSFDDDVLAYAATAPFKTVYDACIMVVSNY